MNFKKLIFTSGVLLFILVPPVSAGIAPASCPAQPAGATGGFIIPDSWKNKFPFDLVYPVGNPHSDLSSKCPTFTLWGDEYQLCGLMTITQIAKTAFVVKLGIDFLTNG